VAGDATDGAPTGRTLAGVSTLGDRRPGRRAVTITAVVVLWLLTLVAAVAWGAGTVGGSGTPGGPVADGFAADMVDHHDQAVLLADHAARRARQPAVRVLATDILAGQRYEMGRLEQYLTDRGRDRPDPERTVMGWMAMPVPAAQMPGLVGRDDVVAYLNSDGAEVDRRFLELLIPHHEGGVHMAEFAADHAENEDLRRMARLMVRQQRDEINQYQLLLDGLDAAEAVGSPVDADAPTTDAPAAAAPGSIVPTTTRAG
jgi:uncharacterized protein (DUF305 family)